MRIIIAKKDSNYLIEYREKNPLADSMITQFRGNGRTIKPIVEEVDGRTNLEIIQTNLKSLKTIYKINVSKDRLITYLLNNVVHSQDPNPDDKQLLDELIAKGRLGSMYYVSDNKGFYSTIHNLAQFQKAAEDDNRVIFARGLEIIDSFSTLVEKSKDFSFLTCVSVNRILRRHGIEGMMLPETFENIDVQMFYGKADKRVMDMHQDNEFVLMVPVVDRRENGYKKVTLKHMVNDKEYQYGFNFTLGDIVIMEKEVFHHVEHHGDIDMASIGFN